MTETRQPTRREALIQRMLFRAETWERGTYGDQGLRLMAEDSAKLLRDAADLLREEGAPQQWEAVLRSELWQNHGCPLAALYGDDGEMQCGNGFPHHRPLDFKRMPMADLVRSVTEARLSRYPVPPPPHQDEQKG